MYEITLCVFKMESDNNLSYSLYLCPVDSAVLTGMSILYADANSWDLSVHFVSSLVLSGPSLAARWGSPTGDRDLWEGILLRMGVWLKRGLAKRQAAGTEGFLGDKGGKCAFFVILDPGLIISLPQLRKVPSWNLFSSADMLLMCLWIPLAGSGIRH